MAALLVGLVPVGAQAQDALTDTATVAPETTTAALTAPALDPVEQARIQGLIERRISKAALGSRSGIMAVNADGSSLWRDRANVPLMPASTMKVVTAVVALHVLGPNWKPVTSVRFDSATGTLALVGGGDSILNSTQLGALAGRVVETVTALGLAPTRLVVDDSLFPTPTIQPGVSPGQLPSEERPVRALVVDRSKVRDSALDAGSRFQRQLAARGLELRWTGRAKARGDVVAEIKGFTLRSALHSMLVHSDNDIAEMVFRLSALGAGRSASWADARTTANEALQALGVITKDLRLVDGSGLSRSNRLTANALTTLLAHAQADPRLSGVQDLLPIAGLEGTLRRRYAAGPATCVQGLLRAKTGSLHDVIALAGYAPADDGSIRPFAVLVNEVRNSASARNRTRASIDNVAAAISGC